MSAISNSFCADAHVEDHGLVQPEMTEIQKRKRVWVWMPGINSEFIEELSISGIDVVAVSPGCVPEIESISLHDLFYGDSIIARMAAVVAPSSWLDAEWFRLYSRCIARIGFVPSSTRMDTRAIGITPGYDMEDMARLHLSHALTVLKGLSIDEVWFADPPHLGVDIMLSLAAQKLGIRVIVCHQVPNLLKFRVWVDDGSRQLSWDLIPRKPWLLGAMQPNIWYMQKAARSPLWKSVVRGMWRIPRELATGGWRAVSEMLHDWAGRLDARNWVSRLLERQDARLMPWVELKTQMYLRFKKNKANIKRIRGIDGIVNFVYFPLHLEPEMNVQILGREYFNQLDAAQALIAALPEGWALLVKENPKQGYMHRGDAFHRRLSLLPGVRFVPDDMPSSELIEKCKIVATIVGTAGYEALRVGKPCIYFGDAWYAGLPGAFLFEPDIDMNAVAAFDSNMLKLDQAMNELLGNLPDGLVYPRYAHLFDPQTLPDIYRDTARTMAAISAAVM